VQVPEQILLKITPELSSEMQYAN